MENTETIQQETTNTPTESVAKNTESTTEKVDIQAILKQAEEKANEIAEKKADAVMKSMLKEKGLDDEAIKTMLNEYKSNQVTPEQTIKELQEKLDLATKEKADLTQREVALLKGVPLNSQDETEKERVNACITLAQSYYVGENLPFDVAIDKALKVISFEKEEEKIVPPSFYVDKGKISTNTFTEREKLINETKKQMKIK